MDRNMGCTHAINQNAAQAFGVLFPHDVCRAIVRRPAETADADACCQTAADATTASRPRTAVRTALHSVREARYKCRAHASLTLSPRVDMHSAHVCQDLYLCA